MIVSHQCQFIVFFDPFSADHWLQQALAPWSDQPISQTGRPTRRTPFFTGMTPPEARGAFAKLGLNDRPYRRIAVVQSPYRRLATLYDHAHAAGGIWPHRQGRKTARPEFRDWLIDEAYNLTGPFARLHPRWRRLGALTTTDWAAGRIDTFVRAEFAGADMAAALCRLNVVPVIDLASQQPQHLFAEMLRYDSTTLDIVRHRFADDLGLYQRPGVPLDLAA